MAPSGRGVARVAVRINAATWREELERFEPGSSPLLAAERERRRLEADGLDIVDLQRCAAHGPDGTRLSGLVKAYVPLSRASASERPFGFVFSPGRDEHGVYLAFVAFGERHPRPGTRSVTSARTSGFTAATARSHRTRASV